MKDVLLLTPPFTQLNTPYPATAYLKGFLNTKSISSYQMDLGIEVILSLFSKDGLTDMFDAVDAEALELSDNIKRIFFLQQEYISTIDSVVSFLQGNNASLNRQICSGHFLPEAGRFETVDELDWAFGTMGNQDKAKHLATLYLEDISDFIVATVDDNFGFSRYAERLGRSANSFDELADFLAGELTYIDALTVNIFDQRIKEINPKLVCISVPFPGNLYSAFRCAQHLKAYYPAIKVAMGGGFPNTELRSLKDARVFDYFDFITLDDGELPVELLVDYVRNEVSGVIPLRRTFQLDEKDEVFYNNLSLRKDYKQNEVGTPDYTDLLLDKYVSVIEVANPMHSLWSDGRWNKLTMAHGCYWGKCTFCDISLDYIKVYEPVAAKELVDRVETLIEQTGETGFHFVDEAAPPALMRAFALEILHRDIVITWWTNIRFEKSFSPDLCRLLSRSGCIAVSGGLEVASDRLLALIDKGVTVEQVAKVTQSFTDSGIMVHSYLMYGYPTQTVQETVDSLEMVRQLFEAKIIQSGFWHQFALTAHSPIGKDPEAYGVIPKLNPIHFANNDIDFVDSTGIDHSQFSYGLKKSLYNYMHDMCFDVPVGDWFDFQTPNSTIQPTFIANALASQAFTAYKPSNKLSWLGGDYEMSVFEQTKKGQVESFITFEFYNKRVQLSADFSEAIGAWLSEYLVSITPYETVALPTIKSFKAAYLEEFEDFDVFWYSKSMDIVRQAGLLVL